MTERGWGVLAVAVADMLCHAAERPKCVNGHAANSDGNCSVASCPYRIAEKHKGIGRD